MTIFTTQKKEADMPFPIISNFVRDFVTTKSAPDDDEKNVVYKGDIDHDGKPDEIRKYTEVVRQEPMLGRPLRVTSYGLYLSSVDSELEMGYLWSVDEYKNDETHTYNTRYTWSRSLFSLNISRYLSLRTAAGLKINPKPGGTDYSIVQSGDEELATVSCYLYFNADAKKIEPDYFCNGDDGKSMSLAKIDKKYAPQKSKKGSKSALPVSK